MTDLATATFVVDASTWIWHERNHAIDVFPTLWNALGEQVDAGRIVTPRQVATELGDGKRGTSAWIRSQSKSIIAKQTLRVGKLAGDVLTSFPDLPHGVNDSADPWLVAFGGECGFVVVTEEKPSNGGPAKLPDACRAYGVTVIRGMEMLRALGVRI